jgi:hypothetical protein
VDFKLENVLVSLHSLKIMGLGTFGASAPLFLRNGELLEVPRPIIFKEWRDTRTFSNLKSTHCTLLI